MSPEDTQVPVEDGFQSAQGTPAGDSAGSKPLAPPPEGQHGARIGGVFESVSRGIAFDTEVHDGLAGKKCVIEIENFNLWYGSVQALYDNSMGVPAGEVTALIGPSGCGKSTLRRCVNRMNDLIPSVTTKGDMRLSGDDIYGAGVDVIELRKRIGMVFQKPNPFPMSIYENMAYPLRIDGVRDRTTLDEVVEVSL